MRLVSLKTVLAGAMAVLPSGVRAAPSGAVHVGGKVLDEKGQPAAFLLTLVGPGFSYRGAQKLPGEINVDLEHAPEQLALTLDSAGYEFWERVIEITAGENVDLGTVQLTPAKRVSGVVVDAATALPISGARLWSGPAPRSMPPLRPKKPSVFDGAMDGMMPAMMGMGMGKPARGPASLTDADGGFTLPLRTGVTTLEVEHPDYLPTRAPVAAGTALRVSLRRGASLRGQVHPPPAQGTAKDWVVSASGPRSAFVPIADDGSFFIQGLIAGSYAVGVTPALLAGMPQGLFSSGLAASIGGTPGKQILVVVPEAGISGIWIPPPGEASPK